MIRTALRGTALVFLLVASAWAQEAAVTRRAKEIEIGRQLAAVLLGSKPLARDMALQS